MFWGTIVTLAAEELTQPTMSQDDLQLAIDHLTESSSVDYKSSFDIASAGDWVEIVKDIVAFANSGGGIIVFGLNDDGTSSAFDCRLLQSIDPATVTDKLYKYTNQQLHSFVFLSTIKDGMTLFAIEIGPASVPIVFSKPGTYDIGGGKQKTAFSIGTMYFRHGAKSEPANSEDLRVFIEDRIERMRKAWFEGIVKVVEAPEGSIVQIAAPEYETGQMMNFRLVDDPSVPVYRQQAIDETHPFRQMDVASEVGKALGNALKVIPYHIQCIRQMHSIDRNPTFVYKLKHASARYSQAFVDWIVSQYKGNPAFFEDAKQYVSMSRK